MRISVCTSQENSHALCRFNPQAAEEGDAQSLSPEARTEAKMRALHLLSIMVAKDPDWMPESLFRALLTCWHSPQRAQRCA